MSGKPPEKAKCFDSYEVWRWPEFKAFVKRLGLDWENFTTDLTIHIPLDGAVSIDESYLANNRLTREPRDTTTMRNDTRRTTLPPNPRTSEPKGAA